VEGQGRATLLAIEQHVKEATNGGDVGDGSNSKLSQKMCYYQLFTKYKWNLFIGLMLHVI
jgi:hypothetical protein